MKADVYIIGSTKPENYELIIKIYGEIIHNQHTIEDDLNSVCAVIPAPSVIAKSVLINNCFTMIHRSDVIIAVMKPDRSFEDDTLYEITHAKSLGRCVYSAYVNGNDITYDNL